MGIFEGRGEWALAMRAWQPNLSNQMASDRPKLEEMTTARWGVEPSQFQGQSYNALALFYEHGPNWMSAAPQREVALAVAHNIGR